MLILSGCSQAKLLSLTGAGKVRDDYICKEYPHQNHGVTQSLQTGTKFTIGTAQPRRTFIKPELDCWRNHTELIDSVHLILYTASGAGHAGAYYYVNRLLVDPAYGDSGSQFCPTNAPGLVYNALSCLCDSITETYCGVDSIPWHVQGCSGSGVDFLATSSDSFTIGRNLGDSARVDLTADFKWFCEHRDSAFGWVIWRDDTSPSGNYRILFSSESSHDGGSCRPRFEIFYSTKRAALVLNDTSSASAIGVDSLLFKAMHDDLDYEVSYMTDDDVAHRQSSYFDTAFDVVVWAGEEVTGPSPSANADTVQQSQVGWLSLYRWNYDENNLGIGEGVRQDARYLTVNRDHWITRVLQDTLFIFMDESIATVNYLFAPDSAHDVVPLIVDEDDGDDTAYATMCAADSGDLVYNGETLAGRRVFLGLFHSGGDQRDSCQFFTIFNRAVAWAAADTGNYYIKHNACFSGWMEVEDSWAESSSGSDSLRSYGAWNALYTGFDFDEKVAFMKVNNDAMRRKLPYDTVTVSDLNIRMVVKQIANDQEDSLWLQVNGIRPIKLLWKCGREVGSDNSHYASWTYRYRTESDSFPWNQGGAHGLGSDVIDVVLDSAVQNRENTAVGSTLVWKVPPEYAAPIIEDTTTNHGWVWHNLYNNQDDQINDAEILYHSSDIGYPGYKPLITVRLSGCGVSVPTLVQRRRYPVVGHGLLGD